MRDDEHYGDRVMPVFVFVYSPRQVAVMAKMKIAKGSCLPTENLSHKSFIEPLEEKKKKKRKGPLHANARNSLPSLSPGAFISLPSSPQHPSLNISSTTIPRPALALSPAYLYSFNNVQSPPVRRTQLLQTAPCPGHLVWKGSED